MQIGDEIFVYEIIQRGWVDQVFAQAALSAFYSRIKEGETLRVWDILKEQKMLTPDQIQKILGQWTSPDMPIMGNYKLIRLLGKGSMAFVYEAIQTNLDRPVALKILTKEASENFEFLSRFRQEAKAAAVLNHPNIVQAYDVGEIGGWQYMAMEFVEGKSLRQYIEEEGHLDGMRVLDIGRQIAMAIQHAFTHKIIHRDIRPDNILINKEGIAKLADFGLVKQLSEKGNLSLTMAGSIVGDPHYIPPEQAMGDSNTDIDVRSDLYSLGVTLYEAVTGRRPFSGTSPLEIISQHLNSVPPKPSMFIEDLAAGVEEIILKMMEKSPNDRYQSPEEIIEAINGILGVMDAPGSRSTQRFTKKMTAPAPKGEGKFYLFQKQVLYGEPPAGAKEVPQIYPYFLKVCKKIISVLEPMVGAFNIFQRPLNNSKELVTTLSQRGSEKPSSQELGKIEELIQNFRILYSVSLHPKVQMMVDPSILGNLRAKLDTFFHHLKGYFEFLGIPQEKIQTANIQVDEGLPLLQSFGLVSGGGSPSSSKEEDGRKRKFDTDLELRKINDLLKEEEEKIQKEAPVKMGERKEESWDLMEEIRAQAQTEEIIPEGVDPYKFLGIQSSNGNPEAKIPTAATPASSQTPLLRKEDELEDSLRSLLGETVEQRGTQHSSAPSTKNVEKSSSPASPSPVSSSSPPEEDSGSWLLGDAVPTVAPSPAPEGGNPVKEDSGSWLLGEDSDGLSALGNLAENQEEQVISLWDRGAEEPIPETIRLVQFDPQKTAIGGSSFIDTRYDIYYRSETSSQEKIPMIEVRVKTGKGSQRDYYQEISIRVKSFRGMDQSHDGKFVIGLPKTPMTSNQKLATWYDPNTRKKLPYIVLPKS
ncbi:MAG: serine/threonine protein kinase, partial [Planctomycetota bacterium]